MQLKAVHLGCRCCCPGGNAWCQACQRGCQAYLHQSGHACAWGCIAAPLPMYCNLWLPMRSPMAAGALDVRLYQQGMLERARQYIGMPASPARPGPHAPDANGGAPPPGAPSLRTPLPGTPGGRTPSGSLGGLVNGAAAAGLEGLSDVDRRQRELYARQQQLLREQRSADQEKLLACISGVPNPQTVVPWQQAVCSAARTRRSCSRASAVRPTS